jgi:hypothetical protein
VSDESIGFVVVEFNQASHQPSVQYSDVYSDRYEAEVQATYARGETERVGRRETYAVAEVVLVEVPA